MEHKGHFASSVPNDVTLGMLKLYCGHGDANDEEISLLQTHRDEKMTTFEHCKYEKKNIILRRG